MKLEMNLQNELDLLSICTHDGVFARPDSTTQSERWNQLVAMGLVERVVLSNLNQYRIRQ